MFKRVFQRFRELIQGTSQEDNTTHDEYNLRFPRGYMYTWGKERNVSKYEIERSMFYSICFCNQDRIIKIKADNDHFDDTVDKKLLVNIFQKLPDITYNYKDGSKVYFFSIQIKNQKQIQTIVCDTEEGISRWFDMDIDEMMKHYKQPFRITKK